MNVSQGKSVEQVRKKIWYQKIWKSIRQVLGGWKLGDNGQGLKEWNQEIWLGFKGGKKFRLKYQVKLGQKCFVYESVEQVRKKNGNKKYGNQLDRFQEEGNQEIMVRVWRRGIRRYGQGLKEGKILG